MPNNLTGWLPNPPDERDRPFTAAPLPLQGGGASAVSLRPYFGDHYAQGPTSSCVAQAVAKALEIRERIANLYTGTPSRLFMYYNSRAQHGAETEDEGTYFRTCLHALRHFGAPDEELHRFSYQPEQVNRQPYLPAYLKAFPRRDGFYYSIFETGDARVEAIIKAIDNGYPVVFGTRIDRAFTSNVGPYVIGPPQGELIGGHGMVIIGYARRPGGTLFEVPNSWGLDWRERGSCWFTEEFIRCELVRDLSIIMGWRRLLASA